MLAVMGDICFTQMWKIAKFDIAGMSLENF